jgi:hypothetical protein
MTFVIALQSLPSWIVVNLSWPMYRKARPYGEPHPWRTRVPSLVAWHYSSTRMTREFNWTMWFSLAVCTFAVWTIVGRL